ncbi:hypothetical protein DCC62_24835 [candidate division KSB1 bacterium]|nr:MAG: hypothetical protein DCC62_24835 [candidate division KSB1 bacterium]
MTGDGWIQRVNVNEFFEGENIVNKRVSRREFLKISGATTAGMTLGLSAMMPGDARTPAAAPLRIGVIGTGDRGAWEVYILKQTPGTAVMACCDILPKHLENGLEHAAKNAKGYSDYRKLLDDPQVDAVLVCTPQHLHHAMALDCLSAGKDIICPRGAESFQSRESLEQSLSGGLSMDELSSVPGSSPPHPKRRVRENHPHPLQLQSQHQLACAGG